MLSIIAAIGKNNELGKNNKLLWKLPADMKHFRDTTRGHTVIMGRKTFESLPNGALPNRRNIVITRDEKYKAENIDVVNSIKKVLKMFSIMPEKIHNSENTKGLDSDLHRNDNQEEFFVIGGAEIYKQTLPFASRLYITHIDGAFDADTFFPEIETTWKETKKEDFKKDENNEFDYSFTVYEK